MTLKIEECQLEVDFERGALYVHSPDGRMLLRVRRVPLWVLMQAGKDLMDVDFDISGLQPGKA